jgi:hypothetical protein
VPLDPSYLIVHEDAEDVKYTPVDPLSAAAIIILLNAGLDALSPLNAPDPPPNVA